ncbi:hypothetical protein ABZ614_33625 [Streptomyces sp. NPDC013178]|uniref:hypothetical protein n=1 Tax=Streptomyces sp. NPDC013178 TaxID=3155118 RepID=UPI0033D46779
MTMQIQQTRTKIPLDDRARGGIAAILDVVLPGTETLPSGRSVGAHLDLLDKTLDADPRLQPVVREVGELAAASDTCTFDDIRQWAGEDLERLVFALNAAYYMSSEVRSALGYPGQGRRPIALATPDEICSDDLIAPVLARGAIYVPTPE